jgi:ATP-dependent DNA helicase RecG
MLHGKMPASPRKGGRGLAARQERGSLEAAGGKSKEEVMNDFASGKIDILVATSVIEVGIDIPNASVMMIEGSDKFGLAQLHQFRGRVGRSNFQSYCFLFTDTPELITNRRLRALVNCDNGFELAEKDLAIRGPGDFTGQRQWGIPDLAMASLTDTILVSQARNDAKEILQEDPELKKYPLLAEKIKEYKTRIHLE